MPVAAGHLSLKEEDVIKLALEFLNNRDLHITQVSLERETGVINGAYSDDVLFLRQLILDGQWEDVLEFIQPLESIPGFSKDAFHYIILKHKYVELLCIKLEAPDASNLEEAVEEVVKVLNDLEKFCPSKEEYGTLCLLLTVNRLSEQVDFKDWNPSTARIRCFNSVLPLVEKYLASDPKAEPVRFSQSDRLLQLIIKGILYESCVDFCQQKATSSGDVAATGSTMQFSELLTTTGFSDSDLSLISWLQSIPAEIFGCPFEQKTLNVDVERLEKPSLETSWTEHMLVTPIKPNIFPHSATPNTRSKSADIMSRSLNLASGDGHIRMQTGSGPSSTLSAELEKMSRSFASFHLTGKKSMNTSVDRLFEENPVNELPTIAEKIEVHHESIPKQESVMTTSTDLFREYCRQKQRVPSREGPGSSNALSSAQNVPVVAEFPKTDFNPVPQNYVHHSYRHAPVDVGLTIPRSANGMGELHQIYPTSQLGMNSVDRHGVRPMPVGQSTQYSQDTLSGSVNSLLDERDATHDPGGLRMGKFESTKLFLGERKTYLPNAPVIFLTFNRTAINLVAKSLLS
ncbi:unnamed protein product [Notodromas monacha]|uniref:CTLH domain-containing protein n=1 Tax=Notodromas monacha TaxID=399045 RepID=A0A7R9BN89_9CRUS|nr:unnamed protein product [Notodromas monacha]CAG0917266.1 unnamed protein product [Notodromas monacha]